jgi:hypothetical protein
MPTDKRINLRFSTERFEKLDEKRFREKLTFQDIGVRLFENWLAGQTDQPARSGLRRPADPYLERFAMLQAIGDADLVSMIKKAIDVAYGMVQHSLSKEELDRLRAMAYGESPKQEFGLDKDAEVKRRGRRPKMA